MERSSVAKPFVVLVAIFLVAISASGAKPGRDVPSVSNNEVNDAQSFTTNLPPAQVLSPYMAYAPEGAFENSEFIFDPHFRFHPWWFWGFHGFPFHHFWGMHAMKAQGGPNGIPIGKYEGGEVPDVGGKVAGKTP